MFRSLISIILVIIAPVLAFFGVKSGPGQVMDGDGMVRIYLTEVTYYCGGGELGGHTSIELREMPDGSGTRVTWDESESWDSEAVTEEFELEDNLLAEIDGLASRREIMDLSEREDVFFVLDGDMWNATFTYSDGVSYTLRESQDFYDGKRESEPVPDILEIILGSIREK